MKRASILFSAVALFHFAAPAYAASGESWEITTKPEVSGISSVPEIIMNVCIIGMAKSQMASAMAERVRSQIIML